MAGWLNFKFIGNVPASPQPDDTEISTIAETGQQQFSIPADMRISDIVLTGTAAQTHQYRIYVNGKAQGANFYSGQLNPATQGRMNWASQSILIPRGSTIQIKGSQKDGATAESTTVTLQWV